MSQFLLPDLLGQYLRGRQFAQAEQDRTRQQSLQEQELARAASLRGMGAQAFPESPDLQAMWSADPQAALRVGQMRQEFDLRKAMIEARDAAKEGSTGFGNVNPGDFEPASIDVFRRTGNYGDLKRVYAPQAPWIGQVGGVPTAVPRVGGAVGAPIPLSTLGAEIGATAATAQAGAAAKAQGERAVADVAEEGRLTTSADDTLALIRELRTHPGLTAAVGVKGPSNYLPATDAAGFKAKLQQLSGKTFLEAINSLRGTGQITEKEGQEAKAAVAALNTDVKEEDFLKNLGIYEAIVQRGADRARAAAARGRSVLGNPGAAPAAPAAPAIGTVKNGYRFKGGNPADRNSWEPVK